MSNEPYDLVVVGCGPVDATAGIWPARPVCALSWSTAADAYAVPRATHFDTPSCGLIELVKDWQSAGGKQIRAELEQAFAAGKS